MQENTDNTRVSLLMRLRDRADDEAWTEFVNIYTPVICRYVARLGLQDADVADVAQEVLRTVSRTVDRFDCDRRKGSFRGWLLTVTRSRVSDHIAAQRKQVSGSGDTAVISQLHDQPAADDAEAIWEQEYRRSVFRWAAERIEGSFQSSTWQAFWQVSVDGESTKRVAAALGMTEGAVYIAKCRVQAKLKETIERYERDQATHE